MQRDTQLNSQLHQPNGLSATGISAQCKRGRPVGSGTAAKLTLEQIQEMSSQRMNHGFLLVSDLQLVFNRGDQWVKDQINSGKLHAKRLGHEYITTWEEVLKFINSLPDVADKKPRQQRRPRKKPVPKRPIPSA